MVVICEECGKKYRLDPEKIRGDSAKVKCRVCNHVISISKPAPDSQDLSSLEHNVGAAPAEQTEPRRPPEPLPETPTWDLSSSIGSAFKVKGLGLRGKMMVLFLIIPALLVAGAGASFYWQMRTLSSTVVEASKGTVAQMAEERVAQTARAVSKQCALYISQHPELTREEFNRHAEFKDLAVQKVGETGYTALYQFPGTEGGVWRTWAHVNAKIIGIDMSDLRKPLGNNFPSFWRIFTGVINGKESSGYYAWQDKDGAVRDKFMVCTPVKGTPYVIAATTYLDEFTGPVRKVETEINQLYAGALKRILAIALAAFLVVAGLVFVYGRRLSGRIKSLTEAADRISVGDLDAQIQIRSDDEIGGLAEAIGRMQESIRLSLERLRKRRQSLS
jgi:predicted Zn finger-like uncharacterized protein